jgi:hypothetical protein
MALEQYECHRHGYSMNAKFFVYGTAAILIGFAVMMLPLALETGPPTYKPEINPFPQFSSANEGGNGQRYLNNTDANTLQPYSITSSSLILLTGLVIAFTAYILFKRQLNQQPTTISS